MTHTPETTRELDARWELMTLDEQMATLRQRNEAAAAALRPMLRQGDRLRAYQAKCNAREARFIFSHWDGKMIISLGRAQIRPSAVYSVNGEVMRF
ncbi:hypothetical protein [Rhizobium sp. PAMB 3182]